MTTNLTPKSDVLFTESPVSWNTQYITPEGFECQLTLRGESGQEVLEKANAALAYLLSNGCSPSVKSSWKDTRTPVNVPENGHDNPPNGGSNGNWCPIHNVEMKRWEKNGRIWFSHKEGNDWCSGKPKRK